MVTEIDTNDAFWDDPLWDQRQEERWEEAHGPQEPSPHSLEWALQHGFDPRDEAL